MSGPNAARRSPPGAEAVEADADLLRQFAAGHDEAAFARLVRRHVDLVYSAALRRCGGNRADAEEVTQHVFTTLARHAARLTAHTSLVAWLYSVTRNAAVNLRVAEQRRKFREAEAHRSGLLDRDDPTPA